MGDGGRIMARYGNGEVKEIAALAMALVRNPGSLEGAGNNMYRVTPDTAAPTYGTAGQGGRGKIKAGALEASTVDMAREFTNLIVYQRGYQANSRVITTADEISQETLNLKR
jgi:flagellar hook protein FlgE